MMINNSFLLFAIIILIVALNVAEGRVGAAKIRTVRPLSYTSTASRTRPNVQRKLKSKKGKGGSESSTQSPTIASSSAVPTTTGPTVTFGAPSKSPTSLAPTLANSGNSSVPTIAGPGRSSKESKSARSNDMSMGSKKSKSRSSTWAPTIASSSIPPTTSGPSVVPGSPTALPTSLAPTLTSSGTTLIPTTSGPTVAPGSPSGAPTTAASSGAPITNVTPTTTGPTVSPGAPSSLPTSLARKAGISGTRAAPTSTGPTVIPGSTNSTPTALAPTHGRSSKESKSNTGSSDDNDNGGLGKGAGKGGSKKSKSRSSKSAPTIASSSIPPTTTGPTVAPGAPILTVTPTTTGPTVSPGAPSSSPTSLARKEGISGTRAAPTSTGPTVIPGSTNPTSLTLAPTRGRSSKKSKSNTGSSDDNDNGGMSKGASKSRSKKSKSRSSASAPTIASSSIPPTTIGPTVTPGAPSAAPTTLTPSLSSSGTSPVPTTAGPTVTPGSPSASPTTSALSIGTPTSTSPGTTSAPSTASPGGTKPPTEAASTPTPTTASPGGTKPPATLSPTAGFLAPPAPTDPSVCTDNPQDYTVNIDLQIQFPDDEFAACDSQEQDNAINTNIQAALNENFPTTVPDWDGNANFGPFVFDFTQEVNNVDPFARRNLRMTFTSIGRSGRILQEGTCSPRSETCTGDYCRWGCLTAATTNCGTSTLTNWVLLADDIRERLAGLGFDCLGIPELLQVILLVEPPAEANARSGSINNQSPNDLLLDSENQNGELADDRKTRTIHVASELEFQFFDGYVAQPTEDEIKAVIGETKEFFADRIEKDPKFAADFVSFDIAGVTHKYLSESDTFEMDFTSVVELALNSQQTVDNIAEAMSEYKLNEYISDFVWKSPPLHQNQFVETEWVRFTSKSSH